jgi:hypothetical protein
MKAAFPKSEVELPSKNPISVTDPLLTQALVTLLLRVYGLLIKSWDYGLSICGDA